jgi:tetratricopeptide (TPR) repeat protein
MKRSADEYAVLLALLDEALDLDVAARNAWLDALPESHSHLRPTLQRMLSETLAPEPAEGSGLQEQIAAVVQDAVAPPETADLRPGVHVGPYELVREIGRGGMGFVWLANRADGAFKRAVALKLPFATWAGRLSERMARERDILAGLEHPNIARFYDAGVDGLGRPFMAMEYVEGQAIDVYCRERNLSIRERLSLILDVAKAVAYAHSKLVVHRDLKPANMLVTTTGAVRLLDFGIAKLIEGDTFQVSNETQFAGRLLTPDYASPEQIRGETIGTAADIYSLAVVTYELLTGSRPYRLKRQSTAQLEEAIAKVDPKSASDAVQDKTLKRQLRGDLDAIFNMAMKKNPAERYATVDAFASDLRRYLGGQTVLARPDTAWYRIRRFSSRNKFAVGAVIAVIAALGAGMSLTLWQAHEATLQATRADQVKRFMMSIFADSDTESGAGAPTTAVALLRAARERIGAELADQPEVRAELMNSISYSMIGQGAYDDGETVGRDAMELSTRVFGLTDPRTISARATYGEALYRKGRDTEAEQVLRSAITDARRRDMSETQVIALGILAAVEIDEGKLDAAIATNRAAVAIVRSKSGIVSPRVASDSYDGLANALYTAHQSGQSTAALEGLRLARLVSNGATTPKVLLARLYLARSLVDEGQTAAGMREFNGLVPAIEKAFGPLHPQVAIATNFLGLATLSAGDLDGSISAFSLSLVVTDQQPGEPDWIDRGSTRHSLGASYAAADRPAAAVVLFGEAIRQLTTGLGANNTVVLRVRSRRALAYASLGQLELAEREFSALAGAPFQAPDAAMNDIRLATLRSLQGRHDEAIALARGAVAALANHPSGAMRAYSLSGLGLALVAAGQYSAAISPLQTADKYFSGVQVRMTPDHARVLAALGRARSATGDRGAAVRDIDEARQFWRVYAPQSESADRASQYAAEIRAE